MYISISLKGGLVGVNFAISVQQRANSRPTVSIPASMQLRRVTYEILLLQLAVNSFSMEDPANFPKWVFLPVDA